MVKVIISLLTDCVTPFPFKRNSAFSGFGQPEFNAGLVQGGSEETVQKGTQKSSQKLIELIRETPSITIAQLAINLRMSDRAVKKHLRNLKQQGFLKRIGPDKGGHWEVVDSSQN